MWNADDGTPERWECARCRGDFPLDALLITADALAPAPFCPLLQSGQGEDRLCGGSGWGEVSPADAAGGRLIG